MRSNKIAQWVAVLAAAGCAKKEQPADVESLLRERQQLDETVWAHEVEAGNYEQAFTQLWDAIRGAEDKFGPLADFHFESLTLPAGPATETRTDLDIAIRRFEPRGGRTLEPAAWREMIASWRTDGWRIIQTDWHHSRFVPVAEPEGRPASEVDFNIHAIQGRTRTALMLKGRLKVDWTSPPKMEVVALESVRRSGGGLFRPVFSETHEAGQFTSSNPLIVYDLDGDGLSEILMTRWNRVLRNRGGMRFEREPLFQHPIPLWESAIVADFDGDAMPDLIAVAKDGFPHLYRGAADGSFPSRPQRCADARFELPSVNTAGDIDGDGDLDLWMTQYRLSFEGGQMPTPYYDANDGHPSYLLRNDGGGTFTDITEQAGLTKWRQRRTYSASFVDLDDDGDLDLFNTADYAGVDIYRNAGDGTFTEATDVFIGERHSFGMGNTFADYDGDGLLDIYVIGMSSTTARRLDRLKLGRDDRPEIHRMRAAMGYGNRLYFGGSNRFEQRSDVAANVARTGWSWGVTSADFDLDGDKDIYLANGHRSGKSTEDYCTNFWRHDIYTGGSTANPEIQSLFQTALSELNQNALSWNGYEKNPLLLNRGDAMGRFTDVGFLLGVGLAYDARSVVSDDLDSDGRPDLLVTRSTFDGRGFITSVHAYRNELTLPADRHWVGLRVGESNPTIARLHMADGSVQSHWFVTGDSFACQHAPVAHFGIGRGASPREIELRWADGRRKRLPVDALNRYYRIDRK